MISNTVEIKCYSCQRKFLPLISRGWSSRLQLVFIWLQITLKNVS